MQSKLEAVPPSSHYFIAQQNLMRIDLDQTYAGPIALPCT